MLIYLLTSATLPKLSFCQVPLWNTDQNLRNPQAELIASINIASFRLQGRLPIGLSMSEFHRIAFGWKQGRMICLLNSHSRGTWPNIFPIIACTKVFSWINLNLLVFEKLRIQKVLYTAFIDFFEEGVLLIFHLIPYHIVKLSLDSACVNSRLVMEANAETSMQTFFCMSNQIF